MLGLLNSHVDPPNSLLCVCLCLLSEGQWIRTPYTCSTQLAGHSSRAPHSCQRAVPARFIIVSEFCISGLWGQKLILTFWVTSCFTVWKFQLDRSIFMDWFKFWHCTWVPTRYWGRQRSLFKSHTAVLVEHCELYKQGRSTLNCKGVSLFQVLKVISTVKTNGFHCLETNLFCRGCWVENFQCFNTMLWWKMHYFGVCLPLCLHVKSRVQSRGVWLSNKFKHILLS